ncbi:MAG: IS982 family transposase, partial [Methylobacter sp.]
MSVEDFIIYVYCCVDELCRTIVNPPLRSRGFMPKLSDAEVITMEIVGEFTGKDHD